MGIALIIAVAVVLVSMMAAWSDYRGKQIQAGSGQQLEPRLAALEERLAELEQGTVERDETIRQLKGEVSFLTNLLGKGSEPSGALPNPPQ